jgi:hypothetical protein
MSDVPAGDVPNDAVPDDAVPVGAATEAPAPRARLWPGLLIWTLLCLLYVALEVVGLVDGLAFAVPLIAALVVARIVDEREVIRRIARFGVWGAAAFAAPVAVFVWRFRIGVPGLSWSTLDVALIAVMAGTVVCAVRPLRVACLRPLGLDPDSAVHAVSAVTAVLTIVTSVMLFGELQGQPDEAVPFHLTDSVVSVLSDGTMALAGIGFLLTRGLRAAMTRLDLRPIRLGQVAVAATLAGMFLVVVGLMEHLEALWLPQMHALENRFDYDFVGVPAWIGALLLSLSAGVGEELVFRGALQPRFGIVITSILFAAAHIQYQVPGIVMIFVVALGLGVIKQRTSTTFTVVVHVLYDIGAFFLPDF